MNTTAPQAQREAAMDINAIMKELLNAQKAENRGSWQSTGISAVKGTKNDD
jgi:hypothetical protein